MSCQPRDERKSEDEKLNFNLKEDETYAKKEKFKSQIQASHDKKAAR